MIKFFKLPLITRSINLIPLRSQYQFMKWRMDPVWNTLYFNNITIHYH